jgi:hypothetical protein
MKTFLRFRRYLITLFTGRDYIYIEEGNYYVREVYWQGNNKLFIIENTWE